jgi:prephenate dehydrogenase
MRNSSPQNRTVAIVGLGQIGGSLALAFRERKVFLEIRGYDRNKVLLRTAVGRKLVDCVAGDLKQIIRGAGLVILAIPVGEIFKILPAMAVNLKPETILCETGSTKVEILKVVRKLKMSNFVGLHPVAGSEKAGIAGWNPDLFQNRIVTITASPGCPKPTVQFIRDVISRIGARPVSISAEKHDQIFSATSHLPYLLSLALTNLVLGSGHISKSEKFLAGAFRDATRVALSSPPVMQDILFSNQGKVARQISALVSLLKKYQSYLENGNESRLAHEIVRARNLRSRAKVA